MLNSKAPEFWKTFESYKLFQVAFSIVLILVVSVQLYIIYKQKPFFVVYVDEKGASELLVDHKEFNGPKFKELKDYTQTFLIAYLGLDSAVVEQRIRKAHSMMSNELLFEHKKKYTADDLIKSVRELNISTQLLFENIKLIKVENNYYHLEVSGTNIQSDNNTTAIAEKRFLSKITLIQLDRTRLNPSGLKIDKFKFKYYTTDGEEIL